MQISSVCINPQTDLLFFSGTPQPTVAWFKDNKEIKDGGKYSVSAVEAAFTLTIKDSTEADAGTYQVKVKNSAGEVSADVQVKVEAKSLKPT